MRKLIFVATLASVLAVTAQAQTTSPAQPSAAPGAGTSTMPPARSTPDAGAPLPGANSFTEKQAKARIEELGYTNITGLAKDSNGVWRGTATKDGRSQNVAIDFRGNFVVSQN